MELSRFVERAIAVILPHVERFFGPAPPCFISVSKGTGPFPIMAANFREIIVYREKFLKMITPAWQEPENLVGLSSSGVLIYTVAHEIFHQYQLETGGWFVKKPNYKLWLEGSAEYAAWLTCNSICLAAQDELTYWRSASRTPESTLRALEQLYCRLGLIVYMGWHIVAMRQELGQARLEGFRLPRLAEELGPYVGRTITYININRLGSGIEIRANRAPYYIGLAAITRLIERNGCDFRKILLTPMKNDELIREAELPQHVYELIKIAAPAGGYFVCALGRTLRYFTSLFAIQQTAP